jgi:hypothetical protein
MILSIVMMVHERMERMVFASIPDMDEVAQNSVVRSAVDAA